jgi:hypothetical protein
MRNPDSTLTEYGQRLFRLASFYASLPPPVSPIMLTVRMCYDAPIVQSEDEGIHVASVEHRDTTRPSATPRIRQIYYFILRDKAGLMEWFQIASELSVILPCHVTPMPTRLRVSRQLTALHSLPCSLLTVSPTTKIQGG